MKALRYLLIAMVMVLASASVQAQVKQRDNTQYQFHSTSAWVDGSSAAPMVGRTTSTLMGDGSISQLMTSGSRLPIAARNGVIVGASAPGDGTPAYSIRRAKKDEGDFEDEDDPDLPYEPNPIGDGLWAMAILAAGYAIYVAYRRRKALDVTE